MTTELLSVSRHYGIGGKIVEACRSGGSFMVVGISKSRMFRGRLKATIIRSKPLCLARVVS